MCLFMHINYYIANMMKIKEYFKQLNIKYLIVIISLSILFAIGNNLIKDDARSVDWFSGQEILEVPEGF